jgi:flagellar biogenesis protein FliO
MKRILNLGLLLLAANACSQSGMLGTKSDSNPALQASQTSGGGWIQMIIALVLVLGIMKFLLPRLVSSKVMTKLGGKLTSGVGSEIKIEETASFPGGNLHLVTVKGRSLLLGTTPTSITTLADLGMKPINNPGDAFMDILDRAVVQPNFEPEMSIGEISEEEIVLQPTESASDALARLSRLMK